MNAALIAALLFVGGILFERILLQGGVAWYFGVGFPLSPELVPIPRPPDREEGRTPLVRWRREGEVVRFWSDPADRSAPKGLHGSVWFWRGPRGIHMIVRWSPPWTPLLAAAWLAGIGAVRGDALIAVPLAVAFVALIVFVFHGFAVRAAAELRWAFLSDD